MSDGPAGTKGRILDAAEKLFGERGFAGTSMRALTQEAGVNVASVNYHFGSKEGLLRAVVRRVMAAVNEDRERDLDRLRSGPAEPTVDALVRAFVSATAGLTATAAPTAPTGPGGPGGPGGPEPAGPGPDERARRVARFVGRVMFEPDPEIRRLFAAEVGPVEGRYLDALTEALPSLSPKDVALRYWAMVGLLALHQAGTLADLHPYEGAPAGPVDEDELIAVLTGLFRTS